METITKIIHYTLVERSAPDVPGSKYWWVRVWSDNKSETPIYLLGYKSTVNNISTIGAPLQDEDLVKKLEEKFKAGR